MSTKDFKKRLADMLRPAGQSEIWNKHLEAPKIAVRRRTDRGYFRPKTANNQRTTQGAPTI